ncbi:right-handed parallel beta-helix repeat-containing protein [bacterium]|nr:right-handed parallel beta-helix repeat-containing protein [bacterium]
MRRATVGAALGILVVPALWLPAAGADPGRIDPPTCGGLAATIIGTPLDDVLIGTPGSDVIVSLSGADVIRGRGGDDLICGGPGDDILFGGPGSDLLHGGLGFDLAHYGDAPMGVHIDLGTRLARDGGRDRLRTIEGAIGSRHADLILGSAGPDHLSGGRGDDRIEGHSGEDQISAGPGDDVVIGGPGADTINGGRGSDACDADGPGCETSTLPPVLFVGPGGTDTADGRTTATALATVRRAVNRATPGTTVWIMRGRYHEAVWVSSIRGTAAAPITVSGVGTPRLLGGGTLKLGFFCDVCRNVTFQGVEVSGFTDIGAGGTLSKGMVLRNLLIHHNGAAVQLISWELEGYGIHVDSSSHITIEGNRVHHNGPNPPVLPDRIMGTGINTYELTDAVITRNRSYRNHGGGILVEDSVRVVVSYNTVFENDLDASADEWWDGGLWLDGGADVEVTDNIFRDNIGPGIQISDEERQHPTGYVLKDNVSTGNHWGVFLWNFGTTGWPDASVLSHSGNDFSDNTCGATWIAPRWDFRTCP